RDGAVLREHEQAGRVDVEAARGGESLAVFWGPRDAAAVGFVSGGRLDERGRGGVAVFGLSGHVADGFVEQDGDLAAEFAARARVERDGLGREDLVTELRDAFAVDADESARDEVVG